MAAFRVCGYFNKLKGNMCGSKPSAFVVDRESGELYYLCSSCKKDFPEKEYYIFGKEDKEVAIKLRKHWKTAHANL